MNDTALIERPTPTAVDNYRQSTDAAGVCREIVLRTAQVIQKRKYVRVEGWEAIATAHGCVASIRCVQQVEGGIEAIAELRRLDTGIAIAAASGFVGEDEKMWASRPLFARRAMAQTRAISRVCRSAFAHVVVLIDADLSTTPAEEIEDAEFEPARPAPAQHAAPRTTRAQPQPATVERVPEPWDKDLQSDDFIPEDLQAWLRQLIADANAATGKKYGLKGVLGKYGVQLISELKVADYRDAVAGFKAILAEARPGKQPAPALSA